MQANRAAIRVLIADDLPAMRADLVKILNELGFSNIQEAQDGKAGWEKARVEAQYGNPFELIFLDINMPQMNGIQLLKSLRGLDTYKKVPIFMVSTENEKDIIIKCIMEGANDYILKPYQADTVKDKLTKKLNL